MENYSTQMDAARRGIVTDQIKIVAEKEKMSVAALDPSFQIMENNLMGADPNTEMNININGTNSINGLTDTYSTNPDQPLFILDGFETTLQRISDLSMDRIENDIVLVSDDGEFTFRISHHAAFGISHLDRHADERFPVFILDVTCQYVL